MKRYLFALISCALLNMSFQQQAHHIAQNGDDDFVFTIVEQPARFPGGEDELVSYLEEKITYPSASRHNGVEGKVYVQFVVTKKGEIESPKVIKGLGYGCDREALKVVKNMPAWQPAKQNGMNVNMQYVLPIHFTSDQSNS